MNVSLDDNQLVVSGEKKAESAKEEKDWRVEERGYGSSIDRCCYLLSRKRGPSKLISTKGAA